MRVAVYARVSTARQAQEHPVNIQLGQTQEAEQKRDHEVRSRSGVFRGFAFAVLPSIALWAGIAWLVAHIR